jgi:hypothetical protein
LRLIRPCRLLAWASRVPTLVRLENLCFISRHHSGHLLLPLPLPLLTVPRSRLKRTGPCLEMPENLHARFWSSPDAVCRQHPPADSPPNYCPPNCGPPTQTQKPPRLANPFPAALAYCPPRRRPFRLPVPPGPTRGCRPCCCAPLALRNRTPNARVRVRECDVVCNRMQQVSAKLLPR